MRARGLLVATFARMPERWRVLGAMAAKKAACEVRERRGQIGAAMTDIALRIDVLAGLMIGCGCTHDDRELCLAAVPLEAACDCRCHGPLSGGGDA